PRGELPRGLRSRLPAGRAAAPPVRLGARRYAPRRDGVRGAHGVRADLRSSAQGHLLRADPAAAVRDLAALQHADPAAADPAAEDAAQRRGPGKGAVSRARYLEHREPDPARVDARAHEPALAPRGAARGGPGDHRRGALAPGAHREPAAARARRGGAAAARARSRGAPRGAQGRAPPRHPCLRRARPRLRRAVAHAERRCALAATILIGQSIGANNLAETRRVVGTSASFFAAISVAMAVAGLLLCRPLLVAMATPADSVDLAVAYMRVIFLALPCLYMYAFVMGVLRGAGDSKTPFYFMLLSVGIDIALNPVFIFGLGPIPRLGIAGSALATFVAQAVSLFALIRHLYRRRHILCLHRDELPRLVPDWSVVATLVRKGLPMSAQMLVLSLSGVLMITLVNRFGVDTTAAFGAALQIWNYIQMPAFAVA